MKPKLINDNGIALLLILWVLALLSVIVGEFCYAMRTEVNITRNFKKQTEAYYVAMAGLNRAIYELIKNQVMPVRPQSSEEENNGKNGEALSENTTGEPADRWRMNVDMPPVTFGTGSFTVRLGNESGKININGAKQPLLKIMVDALDIDSQQKDIIVDSILDWRDKNNLHRLNGAEDDYYNSLPEPYGCKDGDFDSVEELLMVRGVTPQIFYGGLKDLVTTLKPPDKRIKKRRGFKIVKPDLNKININAAPSQVLRALPFMTEGLVQDVLNYRKEKDFRTVNEVASVIGSDVFNVISPYITTELSPFFSVISMGRVGTEGVQSGVEATVEINNKLKKGYRVVRWRDTVKGQWKGFSKPER